MIQRKKSHRTPVMMVSIAFWGTTFQMDDTLPEVLYDDMEDLCR